MKSFVRATWVTQRIGRLDEPLRKVLDGAPMRILRWVAWGHSSEDRQTRCALALLVRPLKGRRVQVIRWAYDHELGRALAQYVRACERAALLGRARPAVLEYQLDYYLLEPTAHRAPAIAGLASTARRAPRARTGTSDI